jgi:starvation-inducible outer membrane lipoprotein
MRLIIFLLLLISGCSSVPHTFEEAMEECMDTGKPSYECYAIIRERK